MSIPGSLLPFVELRFFLDDGTPNAGGFVEFFASGQSPIPGNRIDTYTTSALTVANTNPVVLDDTGRIASGCYFAPVAYKVQVSDADSVVLYTLDALSDPGTVAAGQMGVTLNAGSKGITNFPYAQLATDNLITADTTGKTSPTINLRSASSRNQPLGIKNLGNVALIVAPNGSDSIDALAASATYTIPAASGSTYPAIWMFSNQAGNWTIVASHGI